MVHSFPIPWAILIKLTHFPTQRCHSCLFSLDEKTGVSVYLGRNCYNRTGRKADVSGVSGAKVTVSNAVGGLVSSRSPVGPRVSNGILSSAAVDSDSTGRTVKWLTNFYT